jgi:hypothetical protein
MMQASARFLMTHTHVQKHAGYYGQIQTHCQCTATHPQATELR